MLILVLLPLSLAKEDLGYFSSQSKHMNLPENLRLLITHTCVHAHITCVRCVRLLSLPDAVGVEAPLLRKLNVFVL